MKHNKQDNDQIIIYEGNEGQPMLEVRIENETAWLTQAQLVELFQSSKANISEHIKNIYTDKELTTKSTVRKFRTVQKEGDREVSRNIEHYNLDVILSVGYRVNSKQATQFRIWATKILKQHVLQGYTINKKRIGQNYEKFMQAVYEKFFIFFLYALPYGI